MLRECTNSPKSIASSFLISNNPNICMYTYDGVMKSYIEYCTFFKNIKSGTCEKYKLTTRSRTDYKKFNLYTYSRNFTRSVERLRLLVSLVKINWKPSWNKPIYIITQAHLFCSHCRKEFLFWSLTLVITLSLLTQEVSLVNNSCRTSTSASLTANPQDHLKMLLSGLYQFV